MPQLNRLQREQRNRLIIEMYESGSKISQIQRALAQSPFGRLSDTRIGVILKSEYDAIAQQRRQLAERSFDVKLEQLNAVIRTNWGIINAPCRPCDGKGHMGEDPDKAPGTMLLCERCRGDGKHHSPRDRATASKEVRQSVDQQCKMLGLYAPEKFAFTDSDGHDLDFSEDLKRLDDQELDKRIDAYLQGVNDARAEVDEQERHAA